MQTVGANDDAMVTLAIPGATASVALTGAELRRWAVAGREMLWTADAAVWAETAPILFPVVGWTRDGEVRVAGRRYMLGVHGFARHRAFAVAARDASSLRLVLDSSAATRACYPFDFRLSVTYRLASTALTVELSVENTGDAPMPYACGLHPGFRWPFAGGALDDYRIDFDEAEVATVPVITAAGLFAAARRPVPLRGSSLPLTPALLASEALCFLDARSRGLSFARTGGPALRVETENFRHFALWSRPGAPFLAIEAWSGHGDPDGFAGDLFEKPSMDILAAGAAATHAAVFRLEPQPADA